MFVSLKKSKNRYVVFIEDSTRIGNDLKMCPSGRIEVLQRLL